MIDLSNRRASHFDHQLSFPDLPSGGYLRHFCPDQKNKE